MALSLTPQSQKEAIYLALRDGMGAPVVGIFASYLGFGALVREAGLSVWQGLFSSFSTWALPGQVVVVEMLGMGASLLAVAVAVLLANIRLMPMAVTLFPLLREGEAPGLRWTHLGVAHMVVVTPWIFAMMRCPAMEPRWRTPYFLTLSLMMWAASFAGTASGFVVAGEVPREVALGLVFLNPFYFLFILSMDLRARVRVMALGFGVVLGPVLHLLTPDWGLMLSGLLAGTLAIAGDAWLRRRP